MEQLHSHLCRWIAAQKLMKFITHHPAPPKCLTDLAVIGSDWQWFFDLEKNMKRRETEHEEVKHGQAARWSTWSTPSTKAHHEGLQEHRIFKTRAPQGARRMSAPRWKMDPDQAFFCHLCVFQHGRGGLPWAMPPGFYSSKWWLWREHDDFDCKQTMINDKPLIFWHTGFGKPNVMLPCVIRSSVDHCQTISLSSSLPVDVDTL